MLLRARASRRVRLLFLRPSTSSNLSDRTSRSATRSARKLRKSFRNSQYPATDQLVPQKNSPSGQMVRSLEAPRRST